MVGDAHPTKIALLQGVQDVMRGVHESFRIAIYTLQFLAPI